MSLRMSKFNFKISVKQMTCQKKNLQKEDDIPLLIHLYLRQADVCQWEMTETGLLITGIKQNGQ